MSTENSTISFSSFVDYKKVVLTLVGDLKQVKDFSQKLKLSKSVDLINDVLKRIEADTFTVAVVGEFKRGKSTFINALLGKDILPSDILPCSATLNRVTYGLTPSVKIFFKDGHEESLGIDKLADYVTKLTPESEITAESVKEAVVYYPVPFCQNNVQIIDTPGLNDDKNMTEVTLSVLPQVDAAIMVVLAQSPFSAYEQDFLENKLLTHDLGRVIFVVTGIDRLNNPKETEKLLTSIEARIRKYILQRAEEQFGKDSHEYEPYLKKIGKPKIFGLSAYQALTAKQTNNSELLVKSCFPEFESALEQFLTKDRGAILLQVPVNRLLASGAEIIKAVNIQENALQMKHEQFQKAYESSLTAIANIRERKKQETLKIDQSAKKVKEKVQPLFIQLEDELKQAVIQMIDSEPIKASELSNSKTLTEKLSRKISDKMRKNGEKLAEKIQSEIQHGLTDEIERLKDFADSINKAMQNIETEFVKVDADDRHKISAGGEGFAIAVSFLTGLGGIWSGYRAAGLKGAAVGGAGSVGTAIGAGVIMAVIGLPVSLPAIIAVGILSVFTGGWLAQKIFGGSRVEAFKEDYKAKILNEVEKQLKSQHLENQVNAYISDTFSALKQKINQEVEALLDNTQNTLSDLRERRERDETLNELEQKELNEIYSETQKIIGNAQRLSEYLVQMMTP